MTFFLKDPVRAVLALPSTTKLKVDLQIHFQAQVMFVKVSLHILISSLLFSVRGVLGLALSSIS